LSPRLETIVLQTSVPATDAFRTHALETFVLETNVLETGVPKTDAFKTHVLETIVLGMSL